MAKKMKAADAAKPVRISRDDYAAAQKRVAHARGNAREYAGLAGQEVKNLVERHNLNRKAFNFATSLAGMEEAKRADTIRSLVWYLYCGGYFDQLDMFDPIVDDLEAILEKICGNDTSGKIDDTATVGSIAGSPLPN